MYKTLSGLTGILIAVMIAINGVLSHQLENYTSTVIIHMTGLVCISFTLIASKEKLKLDKNISLFLYSAGAIGVFTVLFNNISFNCLGASLSLSLGLLGQSIASIIIDRFGLLGAKAVKFNKKKIAGFIIISLGILVMIVY